MNFTYSTTTDDGTPSIGADQLSDVSVSDAAGAFDTEVETATPRAIMARQRELAALELATTAETSQSPISHVGRGRELPSTIPDAVENNWVLLAKSNLSRETYGRILHLAQEAASPGRVALRPGSLRAFLSFWDTVSILAPEPEVTLARNGNLVAEWHKRWNRHLDVEFKEDGMVLYGLFTGKIVNEGRDTVDSLACRLIENERWLV